MALLDNIIFKKRQLIQEQQLKINYLYMYGVSENSATKKKVKYLGHF